MKNVVLEACFLHAVMLLSMIVTMGVRHGRVTVGHVLFGMPLFFVVVVVLTMVFILVRNILKRHANHWNGFLRYACLLSLLPLWIYLGRWIADAVNF